MWPMQWDRQDLAQNALDQSAAPIDVDFTTRVEGRSIASNCSPGVLWENDELI